VFIRHLTQSFQFFFSSSTQDVNHSLEINKFKQCKEKIQLIGNIFNDIKSKPFKIIGV
jgi:hypothetical protein